MKANQLFDDIQLDEAAGDVLKVFIVSKSDKILGVYASAEQAQEFAEKRDAKVKAHTVKAPEKDSLDQLKSTMRAKGLQNWYNQMPWYAYWPRFYGNFWRPYYPANMQDGTVANNTEGGDAGTPAGGDTGGTADGTNQ